MDLFEFSLIFSPPIFLDNLEVLHKFLCIVKISFPVILQMWENKSCAGENPHQFWPWWSFIYMQSSAIFPLNVRIILFYPFSDASSFCITCICGHCRRTYQNRLMMSLTLHVSCVYNVFLLIASFKSIYWNRYLLKNYICSIMSLTMVGLDPVPQVRNFSFCSGNSVGCVSGVGSDILLWLESIQYLMLFRLSC